jgi:hypothetical protein
LAATDVAGKFSETDLSMKSNSGRNAYHAIAITKPAANPDLFLHVTSPVDGFSFEADED